MNISIYQIILENIAKWLQVLCEYEKMNFIGIWTRIKIDDGIITEQSQMQQKFNAYYATIGETLASVIPFYKCIGYISIQRSL